jgi:hypothetical protein
MGPLLGAPPTPGRSEPQQRFRRVRNACAVLTCEICSCRSESGKGWFGFIAEDPEDGEGSVVCTYCPPCAERELDARPRLPHYI